MSRQLLITDRPLWEPAIGQRVVVQTVNMQGRNQHAIVLRYEKHEKHRVICRWLREDGQRGRTVSYLTRSIRPCDDAITLLGDVLRTSFRGGLIEYWSYAWKKWLPGRVIEICTRNSIPHFRIQLDNGQTTTWYAEPSTTIRPMGAIEQLARIVG